MEQKIRSHLIDSDFLWGISLGGVFLCFVFILNLLKAIFGVIAEKNSSLEHFKAAVCEYKIHAWPKKVFAQKLQTRENICIKFP